MKKEQTIMINYSKEGRIFEGIGALSAGASSRLLLDYPEPYRSQILDYLFKHKFGASLQHLKVEIGGDVNSTFGTEPSHMRTPDDGNYNRGYEWMLMKEAKVRNSKIYLDCLEWGAPYWIRDSKGQLFSVENIRYIINFINGAKENHGLDIDYIGVWNESPYDIQWIKELKAAIVANNAAKGLSTMVVAADSVDNWNIINEMNEDEDLKNAVDIVGVHYAGFSGNLFYNLGEITEYPGLPTYSSTPEAQESGKILWSNEIATGLFGPVRCRWPNAKELAKICNRSYIAGKMTKVIIYNPITSYYDTDPHQTNIGLMHAKWPWSGYYEVTEPVWVVAHTTQFTEPGWRYIDSGCGYLYEADEIAGSYVTLKESGDNDYSIIIETIDAKEHIAITFNIAGNFSSSPLHIWYSNSTRQFIKQTECIMPENGSFTVTLEPGHIYTISTTVGQQKGIALDTIPYNSSFPIPYSDNFDECISGSTPKFFASLGGAFEIDDGGKDGGKCMRQVITKKGVEWYTPASAFNGKWDPDPIAVIGEMNWSDYGISADILLENNEGYAGLYGRIEKIMGFMLSLYGFTINNEGEWKLFKAQEKPEISTTNLASGKYESFSAEDWNSLKLLFKGNNIKAYINNIEVADVTDDMYKCGMAGLYSGWNNARFDNFKVY